MPKTSLTPQQHLAAAEDYIKSAEERENDSQWAILETELAQAHLMAAGLKMAMNSLGNLRHPSDFVGLASHIFKIVK